MLRGALGLFAIAGVLVGLNAIGAVFVRFFLTRMDSEPWLVPLSLLWMAVGLALLWHFFNPIFQEFTKWRGWVQQLREEGK